MRALRRHPRRRRPLISSALARTEALRALQPAGDQAIAAGRDVLRRIELIRVNDRILDTAGLLPPRELRSLDAIHLATAQQLGNTLDQFVAYDDRLLRSADNSA